MKGCDLMFSDYELGLLYGDGGFQEGRYFFSTTHKELADIILFSLHKQKIEHLFYQRDYDDEKNENWGILNIIEIKNLHSVEELSFPATYLFSKGKDFLRGYIETKGSLFSYQNRGLENWRLSISGEEEMLKILLSFLQETLSISDKKLKQRKEREKLGIISKSFRIHIDRRMELFSLISYIYNAKEVSYYLKNKMDDFLHYHRRQPFGKNRVFKNVKYATQSMANTLDLTVKGIRGGGGGKGYKPVYLWVNNSPTKEFKGWEDAYVFIKNIYEEYTGMNAPIIKKK
jgi:hypothetical protein